MTRDEAIEKAKKLLRLAESDNVHEAALAAQRAQEILDRYELTATVLDQEEVESIEDFSVKGAFLDRCKGKQLATWKSYLSAVIAKANGCRTFVRWEQNYLNRQANATLHIVGRPSDAEKVRYLYRFLAAEVERLCQRDGKGCGKTWRNQFRLGVVDTVKTRLYEGQQATVAAMRTEYAANPQALVKLDVAVAKLDGRLSAVDDWMQANLTMKPRTAPRFFADPGARNRGRKAGKEIQISGAKGMLQSAKRMFSH
jgi:hypothetical protein